MNLCSCRWTKPAQIFVVCKWSFASARSTSCRSRIIRKARVALSKSGLDEPKSHPWLILLLRVSQIPGASLKLFNALNTLHSAIFPTVSQPLPAQLAVALPSNITDANPMSPLVFLRFIVAPLCLCSFNSWWWAYRCVRFIFNLIRVFSDVLWGIA